MRMSYYAEQEIARKPESPFPLLHINTLCFYANVCSTYYTGSPVKMKSKNEKELIMTISEEQ